MSDPELHAFLSDYRRLCEKHGLRLVYDGDYEPFEIRPLRPSDADDDRWRGYRVT